jgi:hypothetical protein
MGEWRYNSSIFNLSNRCRWVVSFMPRPLYLLGKSLRLDTVEKWKSLPPVGNATSNIQNIGDRYTTELSRHLIYVVTIEKYMSYVCLRFKEFALCSVFPQMDIYLKTLYTHPLLRLAESSTSRFLSLCFSRSQQTRTLSRTSRRHCSAGPLMPCRCTSGAMAHGNSIRLQPTHHRCSKTL